MSDNKRQDFIDNLRALLDFLEHNESVPVPSWQQFNVFCDKSEVQQAARACKWEKHFSGNYAVLRRSFGSIEYDLDIEREQICKKVVTGTRIVPATEAIPAKPEHSEDVTEWVCEGSILEAVNG